MFLKEENSGTRCLTGSLEKAVLMVEYIVEFKRRYNRLLKFKMKLQDAVLAFKLLDTAGLTVKDKQLALTACPSVSFTDMKSAL